MARWLSGYPGALDLRLCLAVIAWGNLPVESTIPEQRAQNNKQGDYSHSHQKLLHEFPPAFSQLSRKGPVTETLSCSGRFPSDVPLASAGPPKAEGSLCSGEQLRDQGAYGNRFRTLT